jgi:tetratricopeptide (TPR) repeat protein
MKFYTKQFLSSAILAAFLAAPAFAAGDAPKEDAGATMTKEQLAEKKCKDTKGKVWVKKTQKCEDAQQGSLDIDSIYETARYLAKSGRYDEAIVLLYPISDRQDKRVLNYLGYSWRKSGHIELGLKYYHEALAIDPDYVLVREYLGEALIQKGDIAGAKAQLVEIETRCGVSCEPYTELKKELVKVNAI